MKASQLGELGIIDIFKKKLEPNPQIHVGINTPKGEYEDAGAIKLGEDYLVVTTDMIIGKQHIPKEMTNRQIGKKIVTMNFSDLACMGAKPEGIVVSTGFPEKMEKSEINQIAEGMNQAASEHGASVFGGDVNKSKDLVLAGTAVGTSQNLMLRSKAKKGEIVGVTGNLGTAAGGLEILLNNLKVKKCVKKKLMPAVLEPKAKVKEGLLLAQLGVSCCADITDGLGRELWKVSHAAGVGFLIEEEKIPVIPEVKIVAEASGKKWKDLVMNVGEDFELLFTASPKVWKEIEKTIKVYKIGEVKKEGIKLKKKNGKTENISPQGYDQFNQNKS